MCHTVCESARCWQLTLVAAAGRCMYQDKRVSRPNYVHKADAFVQYLRAELSWSSSFLARGKRILAALAVSCGNATHISTCPAAAPHATF